MGDKRKEIKSTKDELILRLEKKRVVDLVVGATGATLAALGTLSGIVSGCAGLCFHADANSQLRHLENKTKETVSFDTFVSEKQQQLKDDFAQGKITYIEFKEQYEKAYSTNNIREFAKETNNEVLQTQLSEVDDNKRIGTDLLTKGLGTSVGVGAIGYLTALGFDKLETKHANQQKKLREEKISEMAD